MTTKEPAENDDFQKDGLLIFLLPFEKRKHPNALRTRSMFNKMPKEGLLKYLIRQQSIATKLLTKGNLLIGHLPNTPYGNCLAMFPGAHRLNKINIRKVPILVIADKEMQKADFYSLDHSSVQPINLPLIEGKSFITRFSIDRPYAVWIKPGIKIKAVIKGFYLHEANSSELVSFPPFSMEQLLKLITPKG